MIQFYLTLAAYAIVTTIRIICLEHRASQLRKDVDRLKSDAAIDALRDRKALAGVKGTGRLTYQTKRGLIDLDLNR